MDKKQYAREYARRWRAKNKEHLKNYELNRYILVNRYKQRLKRAKHATSRCMFCNKLLDRELKHRKFCRNCRTSVQCKRYLRNLYRRRWYAKKVGKKQEVIRYNGRYDAL